MAMSSAERQAKRREKLLALEQSRLEIQPELVSIYNTARWLTDCFDSQGKFIGDSRTQHQVVYLLEWMQDAVVRIASRSGYEWWNPPVNRPLDGYTLPPIHENVSHENPGISIN